MNCRYCNQSLSENEAVKTLAYWGQTPDVCHKDCKVTGERDEAIECQTIDSDCNDCKHYQRGKLAPKTISKLKRQDGKIIDLVFQPNIFIGGFCNKLNKSVSASPNKWSGLECFEHRRS